MGEPSTELTLEEAELWLKAHDVDPTKLLKSADVKSRWSLIKYRWKRNEAPEDRDAITNALVELERKHPTEIGARLLPRVAGLKEWNELGSKLALDPARFETEIRRLRPLAEQARLRETKRACC